MTDYIISSKLSNETVYAYYRGRLWHWNGSIWKESHLMTQKFERAKAADKNLTPQAFLTNGAEFAPLDEYEIDCAMLDALKNAKPCRNAPVEPVEEHPTPSTQCLDAATAAESQTAASPAAPEGSSPTTETADAASGSDAPGNATGKNAALSATSGSSLSNPAAPTFDFGADDQTNALLLQDAQTFIVSTTARIMAAKRAHDLCANNKNGTWGKWCATVGISRDTGDRLVNIAALCGNIQIEGKSILDVQPLKLLYAAAKPSTPEVVKQAVFTGDITTYKEYQELMAQLKAEKDRADAAEKSAQNARKENAYFKELVKSAEAQTHKDAEKREEAESRYESALADISGLKEQNAQLQQSYHDADESRIAANLQRQKAEAERDKAEARAKNAEGQLSGSRQVAEAAKLRADKLQEENAALKKQPIAAVVDEEEVDRRAKALAHQWDEEELDRLAAEKAWGLADARNSELAKDNTALRKQLATLQARANDNTQADFETANYCASLFRSAWDTCKGSYSRLTGEDLESTFQTLCGALNSIMEEASLLCRQPADYDGGAADEPDV